LEIRFEVPPKVWQKFHQMSSDIGRDVNEVFIEMVEYAYAERTTLTPERRAADEGELEAMLKEAERILATEKAELEVKKAKLEAMKKESK